MARAGMEGWIENRPSRGLRGLNLRELWSYRELVGFLARRDLKSRYSQALLGAAWALIQPLAGALVFTLIFRRIAQVPSDGIPYPLFAFVGLAAWNYVSSSVTKATQSLVGNMPLVTKVYFPRILVPTAATLPGLVDFALSIVLLLGVLMPWYGIAPTLAVLTIPLWAIGLIAASIGPALWLAALNVQYRDINQLISLLIQLWLFASPVAYPSSLVPQQWRSMFYLNPMAGMIEAVRWAVVGTAWPGTALLTSLGATLVLLTTGIMYFQQTERRFADII